MFSIPHFQTQPQRVNGAECALPSSRAPFVDDPLRLGLNVARAASPCSAGVPSASSRSVSLRVQKDSHARERSHSRRPCQGRGGKDRGISFVRTHQDLPGARESLSQKTQRAMPRENSLVFSRKRQRWNWNFKTRCEGNKNEAGTFLENYVLLRFSAFREGTNFHPGGMAEISRRQSRGSGCSPRNKIDKSLRPERARILNCSQL